MKSQAYFGDGVYAEFRGGNIELTANGVGPSATDRIYLEPSMLADLLKWAQRGYPDHNTGETWPLEYWLQSESDSGASR